MKNWEYHFLQLLSNHKTYSYAYESHQLTNTFYIRHVCSGTKKNSIQYFL